MKTAAALLALLLAALPAAGQAPSGTPQQQVLAAEQAFARSMAERDLAAFAGFLADDAVFFDGEAPLRGKAQVLVAWRGLFDGPTAPFSWAPDQVQVLDSGQLALSTGLVRNPAGRVVARFTTIWRQESPGQWRVVFDKGSPATAAEKER